MILSPPPSKSSTRFVLYKNTSIHVRRVIAAWMCVGLSASIIGCRTPAATLHIVPLEINKISPSLPLIVTLNPTTCHYWINDRQELCIAMHGETTVPGLRGRRKFDLSIVLDDVPSGDARAYRATSRTMRSRTRHDMVHTRMISTGGTVSIWQYGTPTMRGRFKLKAIQQSFLVITGWGHNKQVLCLGEFEAQFNPSKGKAILQRTEQQDMKRPPPRNRPIPVTGPDPETVSSSSFGDR